MIDIRYEDYRITSDTHQWKLQEFKGKDKDGKDLWLPLGYYSTLTGAHKGLYQLLLRRASANSLMELYQVSHRIVYDLKTAIDLANDIDTMGGEV